MKNKTKEIVEKIILILLGINAILTVASFLWVEVFGAWPLIAFVTIAMAILFIVILDDKNNDVKNKRK